MPPATLFTYIAKKTLVSVGVLFLIFASIIALVDLIENLRFAGKVENAGFNFAFQITLLRTPSLALTLSPFIFLFASIWTFSQLNRRSEISVMRSAGLSIWKLIGPATLVAAIFGLTTILILDPMSSNMIASSEFMKNDIRGKQSHLVRVLGDGIWLRQKARNSILLINAKEFDATNAYLKDVTVWRMDENADFQQRIDSPEAKLKENELILRDAFLYNSSDRLDHTSPSYVIATSLSSSDLQERVIPAKSMSVWKLPRYILLAQAAGLPINRYQIRFHDLSSMPLKLIAMVFIAAIFSLRPLRSGGFGRLITYSVAAGFILYVVSELSTAMGESGAIPVVVSAWTPTLIATLVAIIGLLQFEDA